MLKAFHRGVLTALLASAAFAALPSISYASHSWGSYHWARTANPFTLKLGDNLNSTWHPYLAIASSDWSASSVLDTAIVAGLASGRRCRPTAGRVEVCNAAYGNNGWLGLAQIWISGIHITQGAAKMNDSYFSTARYNTPAWRRLVMCQEIAHTFGLDHQNETFSGANFGTCMDYTSDPDGPPSNEHPDAHDYAQLETIYNSHLDITSTVSAASLTGKMPPAMKDIDFIRRAQWGKLIHSSHGGWKELYELDFGGGHKVFTFVIWATDEEDAADQGHGRP